MIQINLCVTPQIEYKKNVKGFKYKRDEVKKYVYFFYFILKSSNVKLTAKTPSVSGLRKDNEEHGHKEHEHGDHDAHDGTSPKFYTWL